ncbi:MAG: diguanylate cyclase [Burkholderiales bacterium]|nr:diguanylate cyclase [Burkholderiales bacterium]
MERQTGLARFLALLPWSALLLFLTVTFFAWRQTVKLEEARSAADFDLHVQEITSAIDDRLDTYVQVLRGARGLFHSNPSVDRQAWRHYVDSLMLAEYYPGILGVGYAEVVPENLRKMHEAGIRAEGYPEYSVHPWNNGDFHTAIVYLEPFSPRNRRAFGYDMWTEPVRRAAMQKAMQSGKSAMSGKVRLVQETGKDVQAGFLIYIPIYRNGMPHDTEARRKRALRGWVYSPFRMNDLMRGVLGKPQSEFDIRIYDGNRVDPASLMYRSVHNAASGTGIDMVRHIEIASHPWTIVISSLPEDGKNRSMVIALGGGAFSLLLFSIIWLLVHGRGRAVRYAEKLNHDLIESESRFRASEKRLQEIIELMPVALYIKDPQGRILLMNRACEAQWGLAFDDLEGTDGSRYFPPEQMRIFREKDREIFEGRVEADFEQGMWNDALKQNRIVHAFKKPIYDEQGNPAHVIGMVVDITEQREKEKELELAGIVFDNSDEAIMVTDPSNRIAMVNPAFTEITGYSAREALGKNPAFLASGQHEEQFYQEFWKSLKEEGAWRGEMFDRRKNGEIYVAWMSVKALKDERGEVLRHVAIFSDITQRKQDAERVRHFAHYDVLTGLPNRLLFGDRLHQALSQARREKSRLAVIFVDLDRFKPINDNFGHDVGDRLLKEIAARMTECVRESDTVSRLGGDEFVVLLPEVDSEEDALKVAEKILSSVAKPMEISGHVVSVSASIGISFYPDHGETEDELMKCADIAMYRAKRAESGSVRLYQ